ncbi:toll/interleukin-1 receptor domain-containing protein [Streptomyces tsukubensis]
MKGQFAVPLVFVNYRTGDEEGTATLVERELSRRFGNENVFRASKSIGPGRRFPQELITAVRHSRVLLAVIGPRWLDALTVDGRPAAAGSDDWTRREILEAFESGTVVVPVLVGGAKRLRHEDLPQDIGELADCQYRRLDHRNVDADLSLLADDLMALVPDLAKAAKEHGSADSARERSTTTDNPDQHQQNRPQVIKHRQRGGIGNLHGGFSGTFVSEPQGPVHTGSGHLYQAHEQHLGPEFSGNGQNINHFDGDNNGTVGNRSDRTGTPQDEEQ